MAPILLNLGSLLSLSVLWKHSNWSQSNILSYMWTDSYWWLCCHDTFPMWRVSLTSGKHGLCTHSYIPPFTYLLFKLPTIPVLMVGPETSSALLCCSSVSMKKQKCQQSPVGYPLLEMQEMIPWLPITRLVDRSKRVVDSFLHPLFS